MILLMMGAITDAADSAKSSLLPLHDPVAVFAAVSAIILLAPLLMRLARLPGIVGLILAGVLVGPGAIGLLDDSHDLVQMLGMIGLLYLLFQAGLDIDPSRLLRHRKNATVFGLLTFVIPQTIGVAAALLVLEMNWLASILLASMFASHSLVAHPVAARLGIARGRAMTAGVGGTIITDTLALFILAVVAASQGGGLSIPLWVIFLAALGMFSFVILWGVPRIGRWYFRQYADGGVRDFVFVLAIIYGSGFLAHLANIEPLIGAFLSGFALARLIPVQSTLMSRLKFVGSALLVPFFLVWVGMLVDVGAIMEAPGEALLVMVVMCSAVLTSKFVAAKAAQRVLGFSASEGTALFGLSVPQAAATLAAAFIGLRLELFDAAVLNGAVLMILLTCLIGPWVLERSGRMVALSEDAKAFEPGTAPLRILIPMANPSSALPLLDLAFMIRRPHSPEPVYPITVASDAGNVSAQVAQGEQMLGHAVIHASNAGVPVVPITSVDLDIAAGIGRAVKEYRISTIVVGWSGTAPSGVARSRRGGRSAILGGVIDRILEGNPQTVLVCRLNSRVQAGAVNRILLIVPRFIEREPTFPEAVRIIKQLASRLKLSMVVYASDVEAAHVEATIGKIRPHVETELSPVGSWQEISNQVAQDVREEDLLIMFNAREGRLPWSPDLHRLPRHLAQRFGSNNLVVFYPAELTTEMSWLGTAHAGSSPGLGIPPLSASRVRLNLPSMSYEDALLEVILEQFADDATIASNVRDALVKNAMEYSTEVAPGVALLHAHVQHVDKPRFFLATCATGLTMPRSTASVHVLLILLSPVNLPPETHLRSLAGIAHLVSGPDIVERLLSAGTFHQLREQLRIS